MKYLHVFSAAIMMVASSSFVALAKEDSAPLWSKSCGKSAEGQQICGVEQFAVIMPQKKVVLRVVYVPIDSDHMWMVLTVPLGALLAQGVSISVDGSKPITLPYHLCTDQGCVAKFILDKSALENFAKGKALVVRYALSEKEGTDIPIRLEGLAEALKSLSH